MNADKLFERVHELTGKYPNLDRSEIEELNSLSDKIIMVCSNTLVDMVFEDLLNSANK